MRDIPFILVGVFLNAFAQLFLKKGMMSVGPLDSQASSLAPLVLKIFLEPFVLAGLTCYVVSVGVWMFVLSRSEVSFAYPFLSIGYVVTALGGYYFFSETLSISRIAGIVTICLGVILISRTS